MRFTHYTDRAVGLAVALVNATRDAPIPVSVLRRELAPYQGGVHAVRAEHLPAVQALGADLRAVFAAEAEQASALLNRLIAAAPVRPHISAHDGQGPHLHFASTDAGLVERLRVNSLMGLAVVLCDHGKHRFSLCAAAGCGVAFVDTSRNGRRRFCSEPCANRTHVAGHRRRTTTSR